MNSQNLYCVNAVNLPPATPKRTVRTHLNADTLLERVREDFQKVPDARADNAKISLDDALMLALALFQLKEPTLLTFDIRRREEPEYLRSIFGITTIPCDSQMRTLLDPLELASLRAPFRIVSGRFNGAKILRKWPFLIVIIC